jgi:hypothetical protein
MTNLTCRSRAAAEACDPSRARSAARAVGAECPLRRLAAEEDDLTRLTGDNSARGADRELADGVKIRRPSPQRALALLDRDQLEPDRFPGRALGKDG